MIRHSDFVILVFHMRVLVVEDSQKLRDAICRGLRHSGYAVDDAGDGKTGLYLARSASYDVIVLDWMLPGMDGMTMLRELRQDGRSSGVLMLTARDAVEHRVEGLRSGADDYLVKPFAFDELLARVQAIGRRGNARRSSIVEIEGLQIDLAARSVRRGPQRIELAAREYALLEFLVLRRGQIVSRSEIEGKLYEDSVTVMSNVVDSAIYALRRKIDVPGKNSLIRTRRGMGYVLGEEI